MPPKMRGISFDNAAGMLSTNRDSDAPRDPRI